MIVQTSVQLEEDHHLSMAALALVGIWVEEMYHAVNVIESYHAEMDDKDVATYQLQPLILLVLGQEKTLEDLIQVMEDIPHDDQIRKVLNELRILKKLFQNEMAAVEAKQKENPDYVIEKGLIKGLSIEIEAIRRNITTP
jgi:F0F1-type ATP synthase beta subunit